MKKVICAALAVLMMSFTLVSCEESKTTSSQSDDSNKTNAVTMPAEYEGRVAPKAEEIDLSTVDSLDGVTEADGETDYVLITVEGYGQMLVRLFPDVAPITVRNFKKLVGEGFYDGLTFHRVIKNFMIQGGDPLGNGTGGSDENIFGDFSSNGFENNLAHKRGVVAMARSNDPNSASSQFYICHKDSGVTSLDGNYATFGFVVYGIEVVDQITKVNTDTNDKPLKSVVISSIKFVNVD